MCGAICPFEETSSVQTTVRRLPDQGGLHGTQADRVAIRQVVSDIPGDQQFVFWWISICYHDKIGLRDTLGDTQQLSRHGGTGTLGEMV